MMPTTLPKSRQNTLATENSNASAVPSTIEIASASTVAATLMRLGIQPSIRQSTTMMPISGSTCQKDTSIEDTGNISSGIGCFWIRPLLRTIDAVPAENVSMKNEVTMIPEKMWI